MCRMNVQNFLMQLLVLIVTLFDLSSGGVHLNILEGHSYATMLLICNNAAQGILSSFFFKYAGNP